MPYDPNFPATNSDLNSAPFREQFQGLKALIDLVVPIGTVLLWNKDMSGTPALPPNFRECDGSPVNDPESPYNGQAMPDYNNSQRFPRASTSSGQTGGIDSFGTATAETFAGGTPLNVVSPDFSPGAMPIPPFATFVFVMRIK